MAEGSETTEPNLSPPPSHASQPLQPHEPPQTSQIPHSGLSLHALRRSLHKMRCLDPAGAEEFVQEVLFKAGEMRSQGCGLTDEEVMCVLLNGLPKEFCALVEGVDHKHSVTLEELIESIRHHSPRVAEEADEVPRVEVKGAADMTQAEFFAQNVWESILSEAVVKIKEDGGVSAILSNYFYRTILEHKSFGGVLAHLIACKLSNENLPKSQLFELVNHAIKDDPSIIDAAEADLMSHITQDPACKLKHVPLLYAKGFLAVEAYRIGHWYWGTENREISYFLHSRVCEVLGVDIHPAARIGKGLFIDHGTGVVIGETSIIENNVCIFHEVTLGGTGKQSGDRHPIVREGAFIGAGAKILGRIEIGKSAKIGAGSVVVHNIPAHTTVTGAKAEVRTLSNCEYFI